MYFRSDEVCEYRGERVSIAMGSQLRQGLAVQRGRRCSHRHHKPADVLGGNEWSIKVFARTTLQTQRCQEGPPVPLAVL